MENNLTPDKFSTMLNTFNEIIKGYPQVEKIKTTLLKLKEEAGLSNELTFHQKDSIIARCQNYLKNDYGNQRKNDHAQSDYDKSRMTKQSK